MKNKWIWLIVTTVLLLFIYMTRGVLLPFLAGLAVAYFLDPVADKLEERKVPRGAAAAIVIGSFFLLVAGGIVAVWPVLQTQVVALATSLPETASKLRPWLDTTLHDLSDGLGLNVTSDVNSVLALLSEGAVTKMQATIGGIVQGGLALFNLFSLLLISPVVAFYLLRDWDKLVAKVNSLLPSEQASVIRSLATEVDRVLAGFVRGQMLVSSAMGILYTVGWMLVGLKFAIILGLIAGIMSFIPFVGALFAAVIAVVIGIGQWGFDAVQLGLVGLVFLIVQALEGSVLTPRFIGERVGLHPVWVLFAVFAGGEIMGFVGVLIALPASAVIAVLVRYSITRYMEHNNISPDTELDPQSGYDPKNVTE